MIGITVVIPTFNRAPLLGRAIESALDQTVRPEQVIVIDDGSADNTAEVCQAYAGRLEYVRQANAGASAARNLGIRLARHAWLAFLDSDDYWTPSHLERMVAAIEGTGGKGHFYFCDMQLTPDEGGGTLWEITGFHPPAPFHLTPDATAWMLMKRQPTMLQCSVFSKAVLDKSGGLLPQFRLMHDPELFCRIGIGAPVCAVSGVGCVRTADDVNTRLVDLVPPGSEQHVIEQSMLWRSVLDRFPKIEADYKRLLRGNVADAYWRLCRFYWRSGRMSRSLWNLLRAGVSDPALLVWLLRNRSSTGYGERFRTRSAEPATASHRELVP